MESQDLDLTKNYVFDGVEVKCTGRKSSKPSAMNARITLFLYEIVPTDPESIQFKRWVKPSELYSIE